MSACSACGKGVRVFGCDRCGNLYCDACSALTSSEIRCIELKKRTLLFYCETCRSQEDRGHVDMLEDLFNSRMEEFLKNINSSFENLKENLMALASQKLSGLPSAVSPSVSTYAKAVSKNSQQSVVVKPKNASQKNSQTKIDLVHGVDPVGSQIKINNVKQIRNGGLVVNCRGVEDANKLVQLAEENLSSKYEIHPIRKVLPRVRVAGISEKYDKEVLRNYIVKQNEALFHDSAECKVLEVNSLKNKTDLYQATLQLDSSSYGRVLESGCLLVGFEICRVFDAVEITRCFRCNGFNHTSRVCKRDHVCPRCGAGHDLKECTVSKTELCCINCKLAGEKSGTAIDAGHAVWDYNACSVYKQKLARLKADLFGAQ